MEIDGYSNYKIFEDGRVWSKNIGRCMKPSINGGYLEVPLRRDKKRKKFRIHRLLAIHFIPNPENKPCVDHIDGNKSNNNLSNLRWVTVKENSRNRVNIKGISFCKTHKRWVAQWYVDEKQTSKNFKTEDEAISYRQAMVDIYYNRPIIT